MSLRHTPWTESHDFGIGLRPIAPEAWFEGGEADPAARKDALYQDRGEQVWAEAPGSRLAQAEAAALVGEALGRPLDPAGWPPLYAAAREVPDDLCLMERREGTWRLTALSLSAGTFFTAREVVGKSLAELHGPVTGFGERFLARVVRIFDGLRPGLVLERRNWTVVNTDALFTPTSAPYRAQIAAIDPARAAEALFVRVERQTLRRLPDSGGVLFTIRIWRDPLAAVLADARRAAAFAQAWRSAPEAFRVYKGFPAYDALVARALADAGLAVQN